MEVRVSTYRLEGTDFPTIIPILLNIKVLFAVNKTLLRVRKAKSKGSTGHYRQLIRAKSAQKSVSEGIRKHV